MPFEANDKIFETMHLCLEEAERSPIPTYKIGAVIDGHGWLVARNNHWPNPVFEKLDVTQDIGNSSPSIHAETAAITACRHPVEGADLYISDPFCPNCAKNIAESGSRRIFLNEQGFAGAFYKKRGQQFESMSLQIAQRAGIAIYSINSAKERIETIFEPEDAYMPPNDSPVFETPVKTASEAVFKFAIAEGSAFHKRRKFAVAMIKDKTGVYKTLTVRAHPVIGYTMTDPDEALDLLTPIGKYSFIQEPVNRLLMYCARKGYRIEPDYLYCSQVPTSREQVNLIGAGYVRITVGDHQKSRDSFGFKAMKTLKDAGIMVYD